MTGGEVAAAAAAAKALGKAVAEDASQKTMLRELAKDSPHMRMASDEYAKRVAIRQAAYTKMMAPIARLFGIRNDYFENGQFAEDLARKSAHISEDEIVEPSANVAVQAMQGLGFSLEEPDLKDMYLNLLATASERRRADAAHPSFADIIKQLTGREAQALQVMLAKDVTPTCHLVRKSIGTEGETVIAWHLLPWTYAATGEKISSAQSAVWVDNWVRLGLVNVMYDKHLTAENAYKWCEEIPELVALRSCVVENESYEYNRGVVVSSAFGKQFLSAVTGPSPEIAVDEPAAGTRSD